VKRLNMLVIIPHDLGVFLGCYGNRSVCSPRIDGLASEGVRFSHCFTTAPECTPSRGSLMTGLYPHQNGLMGLANFGWSLRTPHLAERLRSRGYRTHQFGFQHETHEPVSALGYDQAHRGPNCRAENVCAELNTFLHSAEAAAETPWFAYAGFTDVHRPWRALSASRFDPARLDVPPWLPDAPVVRKDLARFYQDIEQMDAAVGTVLDTLRDTGIARDTIVVFTTDHGAAFPGAKATLYDPGIHVPLIVRRPGHTEGGRTYDELVSNMDLTPTLLELAGLTVPAGLEGRSLAPLLCGQPYAARDEVGGALFYDVAYDPMHYVRTADYKYIRSFAVTPEEAHGAAPETLTTFAAGRWIRVDDFDVLTSPTWQALAPEGAVPRPDSEELYALRSDPCERRNLVGHPDARPVLDAMRARLARLMERTRSPLLYGHVSPPEKQREACRSYHPTSERSVQEIARRSVYCKGQALSDHSSFSIFLTRHPASDTFSRKHKISR
jgi:N-sulfoglucosamine sulfohydrolase